MTIAVNNKRGDIGCLEVGGGGNSGIEELKGKGSFEM